MNIVLSYWHFIFSFFIICHLRLNAWIIHCKVQSWATCTAYFSDISDYFLLKQRIFIVCEYKQRVLKLIFIVIYQFPYLALNVRIHKCMKQTWDAILINDSSLFFLRETPNVEYFESILTGSLFYLVPQNSITSLHQFVHNSGLQSMPHYKNCVSFWHYSGFEWLKKFCSEIVMILTCK